ncbi:MAG: hypothetical protein AAGA30_14885 [Planctomycetota bacterium]
MKLSILFFCLALGPMQADDDWTPGIPDPNKVLDEAQEDTRAGRYEDALKKFVWFHENALTFEPAMVGVRLSFALGYWGQLAQEYPPAKAKLVEFRDEAKKDILAGKKVFQTFSDFEAINRQLGQSEKTKDVFVELDKSNPKIAKNIFRLAKKSLVEAKMFDLMAKYVQPKDFDMMKMAFQMGRRISDDERFGKQHLDFINKKFANDVETLVALLSRSDRQESADKIAQEAKELWDDAEFHKALARSAKGEVPAPWP